MIINHLYNIYVSILYILVHTEVAKKLFENLFETNAAGSFESPSPKIDSSHIFSW